MDGFDKVSKLKSTTHYRPPHDRDRKNDAGLIDMVIDIGAHELMIRFQSSTGSKPIAR